jgi:3',5'-cyclic AMP phosphodiesterase CpdA
MPNLVRLAHLSDVHLTTSPLGWKPGDWFSKRVTGWISTNWGSRRWRFRHADTVLALLVAEIRGLRPDGIIFSGDATMLGFATETARTAAILEVGRPEMPPGIAVPGNHDYYTPGAQASGDFEKWFAPWQQGQRVDTAIYPFARQIGPVWLVGVNGAVGHRLPFDATGCIDPGELERLGRLLGELPPGPRILVHHFPVADRHGESERRWHALGNLAELLDVARRGGVCLWLHGHRHGAYVLNDPRLAPFPIVCAGSATDAKHANLGYNQYTIDGSQLRGLRRVFDLSELRFRDADTFELTLPTNQADVVS